MRQDSKATTIRLRPETLERVRKALHGRKLNPLVEELLDQWLEIPTKLDSTERSENFNLKEVQQSLVDAITKVLHTDTEWLTSALLNAEAARYEASLVGERTRHYKAEKSALAERFTPWLLSRAIGYINSGRQVRLIIDSGSGTLAFFKSLGTALRHAISRDHVDFNGLEIVTNNIAGAEAYMHYSRIEEHKLFISGSHILLSDYVPCHLLPGCVAAEYACCLGRDTIAAVDALKQGNHNQTLSIGLLAANWVRIEGRTPRPLVHNPDQIEFKRYLLDVSDECYIPVPTAKIFLNRSVDTINTSFSGLTHRPYSEVESTRHATLVTSVRPSTDILFPFSEMLKAAYGCPSIKMGENPIATTTPIDVPAFLYEFEHSPVLDEESQIAVEFPHPYAQSRTFIRKFFFVSVP